MTVEALIRETLLDLKAHTPEVKMIPRIGVLSEYLKASIVEVRALAERYPREVSRDWEELNRLFLTALEMFGG
jgi:hypothetical protein